MKYFTDEQLARLSEKYSIGDFDFLEEILICFDENEMSQEAEERYIIKDFIGLNGLNNGVENGYFNGILTTEAKYSIQTAYFDTKADIIEYLDIPEFVVEGVVRTVDEVKEFTVFQEIQHKAEELGVTVNFNRNDIIDFQHLDCTWYYNHSCVASITKEVNGRQYELLLVPSGEINLYGCIDGKEVEFKNETVNDLINEYDFDDNKLEQFSNSNDENNYLEWDNNNWIAGEVAVNNEICNTFDEILDDNILDNMNDLSSLVDMLDKFIKEHEATLVQRKNEPEIEMGE